MSASLTAGQYTLTGIIEEIPTNVTPPIPSFDVAQLNINVTPNNVAPNLDPQGGPSVP